MATDFCITIASDDPRYARQAADEASRELDRLDALLSRHVAQSDVARVGDLNAGESLVMHPDTYDCLRVALAVEAETRGAFNIAFRQRPRCRAAQLLALQDVPPSIRVACDCLQLDLGGLGKGFALDCLAALLIDWDLPRFLLRASASTLLAGQPPPDAAGWPVKFGPPNDVYRLRLRQAAMSGSGLAVKPGHIVDPRTGRPATARQMCWAATSTAAEADALSTALMVMSDSAALEYCRRHPDVLAYVLDRGQGYVRRLSREHPVVFR